MLLGGRELKLLDTKLGVGIACRKGV